jgi:hypothetical protein
VVGVRRAVLAIVIGLGVVVLAASPAAADPARPTNTGSHVTAVVPSNAALDVDLLGGGAFLQLRVRPGTTVTVMGYEGEPYLRVDADGTVQENRNSKATYLNRTLTGTVDIPPTAGPDAPPDWRRVAGGGSYAWHDHRVHWMAAGTPPARQDWQVPLLVDGVPATINGWYAAEGAPSPVAWWLIALVVATGAVVAGWYGGRRGRIAVAAAIVIAAALGLPVAVAVGRLPASGIGDWTGAALLAVAVAAAIAASVSGGGAWLAGAGLALVLWAGRRLSVLDHAVLVTSLPAGLDRLAVAAGCGAGAAAIVIGVRAVLRPVSPSGVPRPD